MIDAVTDLTEDAFLGGQLRLKQRRSGHRAGHDAILLAAATQAQAGDRVVDLGAGITVHLMAFAGENGPELVSFNAGDRIYPSGTTPSVDIERMQVTINNPVGEPSERSLSRVLTRVAYLGLVEDD